MKKKIQTIISCVVILLLSFSFPSLVSAKTPSKDTSCITSKSKYDAAIKRCGADGTLNWNGSSTLRTSYGICVGLGLGTYTQESTVNSLLPDPAPDYYITKISVANKKKYKNYCKEVANKCVDAVNKRVAEEKGSALGLNDGEATCVTQDTTSPNAERMLTDCKANVNQQRAKDWRADETQNVSCQQALQNGSGSTAFQNYCKDEMNDCEANYEVQMNHINNKITNSILEDSMNFWDQLFNTDSEYVCGGVISDRLATILGQIYKTITTLAVVVVIVLGALDFFKATSSDDADAMKKSWSKFVKRLIAAILLAVLPTLLKFILGVFGVEGMANCLEYF